MADKCKAGRERRSFFRIQDQIFLTYQIMDEEEYLEEKNKASNSRVNAFNLKAQFAALDRSIKPVMRRLESRSKDLAEYLQAIDDKLEMLAEVLFQSETGLDDLPSQEVNISAGGLSFEVQNPIDAGRILKLRMMFPYTRIGIESFGRVVYCQPSGEQAESAGFPFRVGVEFKHMRVQDTDLIIRHVLCKEQSLRRHDICRAMGKG